MNVVKINNSPYDANAYLVNRTILVDVGMDGKYVISELRKEISLDDLEMIVLTHCHFDHSGGAQDVADITGAKIAIHENDAPFLGNSNASASSIFGKKANKISIDVILKGGEKLDGLEVIHTPGHTPGGICLYDEGSKILFSGDTVFQDGSFGRTDLYGGDYSQLISSIKKLTMLDVYAMYPGHGDIVLKNANEHIKMSLMMASQYFE